MNLHQGVDMAAVAFANGTVTMQDLENGLKEAVTEVILTMFNYQPIIYPCRDVDYPGLSAFVGFGGRLSGVLALHINPENACVLASGLLGMSFEEADDVVFDAMGEVVNMLAGGLKKNVCHTEELFKISIPSVVSGKDYSTHVHKNSEQLVLGVQAGPCSLTVQLVVEQA
jgi:chemotaxis protein CheX